MFVFQATHSHRMTISNRTYRALMFKLNWISAEVMKTSYRKGNQKNKLRDFPQFRLQQKTFTFSWEGNTYQVEKYNTTPTICRILNPASQMVPCYWLPTWWWRLNNCLTNHGYIELDPHTFRRVLHRKTHVHGIQISS
jgi:hypothetical protein